MRDLIRVTARHGMTLHAAANIAAELVEAGASAEEGFARLRAWGEAYAAELAESELAAADTTAKLKHMWKVEPIEAPHCPPIGVKLGRRLGVRR